MKISDPSFKFVIPNSRRFKYIVVLDLVWTYTGLIYILYRKTPISILLGVCGNGSVPLSHSGNVVTRIGIHTHTAI